MRLGSNCVQEIALTRIRKAFHSYLNWIAWNENQGRARFGYEKIGPPTHWCKPTKHRCGWRLGILKLVFHFDNYLLWYNLPKLK